MNCEIKFSEAKIVPFCILFFVAFCILYLSLEVVVIIMEWVFSVHFHVFCLYYLSCVAALPFQKNRIATNRDPTEF